MELSDYDILGITDKATFRLVKNAYYELSRIYHPDTSNINSLTKEEKLIAFQRIQKAYENIKEKLNVVEVDLPQEKIEYSSENFDKPNVPKNEKLMNVNQERTATESDTENNTESSKESNQKYSFNKMFNEEFEKINSFENKDNPFSIHYEEPDKEHRNLQESSLIINEFKKVSNIHEFGINYIEDHSNEKYFDVRKFKKEYNESGKKEESGNGNQNENENIDTVAELDKKLEELIRIRNEKIEINEEEKIFIERQNEIKKQIQISKDKVTENRVHLLLD